MLEPLGLLHQLTRDFPGVPSPRIDVGDGRYTLVGHEAEIPSRLMGI